MSGGNNTTSTTTSSPPSAYTNAYSNIVGQAQNVLASNPTYTPYSGQTVAGLSPDQLSAIQSVQNLQGTATPYINAAAQEISNSTSPVVTSDVSGLINSATGSGITNAAGTSSSGVTNAGLGAMGSILGTSQNAANTLLSAGAAGAGGISAAGQTGAAGINQAGASGVSGITAAGQTMNPGGVGQWLSPYTADVVNATEQQFQNQNQIQQNQLAGNAVSAGAFGGDRQGVAQAVLGGQQQAQEAPVIAGLYNQGYQTALQALETQGAQGIQAETAAGQLGVQAATSAGQLGLGAAEAAGQLGVSAAQGAGQLGLSGAQSAGQLGVSAATSAGQFGLQGAEQQAGLQLQGAGTLLGGNEAQGWLSSQAGYGLANLGNEAVSTGLSTANAQMAAGNIEQSQAQSNLNVPYYNYVASQAYPFQTTGWLSNIVEGLGSQSGGTSSTTSNAGSGNTTSNVLGTALAGTGILSNTGAFTNNSNSSSGGGWLSSLFGSGSTASTASSGLDTTTGFASGGPVPGEPDYDYRPNIIHDFNFGRRPERRASGGLTTDILGSGLTNASSSSASAPEGSSIPVGTTVPNLNISIVPGASSAGSLSSASSGKGTFNLTNPNLQDTTQTTSSSSGSSGILGSLLGIGSLAAKVFADGGEVPGRQFGGRGITGLPMSRMRMPGTGRGITSNDNMMHMPHMARIPMRAAGGISTPTASSANPNFTFLAGPGGVSIPQMTGSTGSGISGGANMAAVNNYLNASTQNTQTPNATASTTQAATQTPTITITTNDFVPATTGSITGAGEGGGGQQGDVGSGGGADQSTESGGMMRRGGIVPQRQGGGASLPDWAIYDSPRNYPGMTTDAPRQVSPADWGGADSDTNSDYPWSPTTAGDVPAGQMGPMHVSAPTIPTAPLPDNANPNTVAGSPQGGGGITTMPTTTSDLPPGIMTGGQGQGEHPQEPHRNWGDMLVAMGAGMLERGSRNPMVNIGYGLSQGLKESEQQKVHEETAALKRLQQEQLNDYRQQMIGVQNRRTDIAGQRADTANMTAESRAQLGQLNAELRARGLDDHERATAINQAIATGRLNVSYMSEQDRQDRNTALQTYQNWNMQHQDASLAEKKRMDDWAIQHGMTEEDIHLFTGSKDITGHPTLTPTQAQAAGQRFRDTNATLAPAVNRPATPGNAAHPQSQQEFDDLAPGSLYVNPADNKTYTKNAT